jgi:hypothetical protein
MWGKISSGLHFVNKELTQKHIKQKEGSLLPPMMILDISHQTILLVF